MQPYVTPRDAIERVAALARRLVVRRRATQDGADTHS